MDEIVLSPADGRCLCHALTCQRAGTLADVVVTFGRLGTAWPDALWPECWEHRFRAFDAALDHHHPAGTPHHHLALMAVSPGHQGQGTGSALLRAHHAILDHLNIPAYLEASAPRNRALYQRHGYALRPGAPFRLPDGGPPMWPMWRAPSAG
ncbi:MAG TPA: GNAT family N-acetyltransferase [Streptosporangiaceae bacterium]